MTKSLESVLRYSVSPRGVTRPALPFTTDQSTARRVSSGVGIDPASNREVREVRAGVSYEEDLAERLAQEARAAQERKQG